MLNIYIPTDIHCEINKRFLFILVRPFYSNNEWIVDNEKLKKWGVDFENVNLVSDHTKADVMILPYSINHYMTNGFSHYLEKYNNLCYNNNITAYGFISGDYGLAFPEFDNITYFRMGGFRSQLSERNIGFPAALSDHHLHIFGSEEISIREKNKKPLIGFCGHSNSSQMKRAKESLMYILENIKRFINNPLRKDYETIFPSGYYRSQILFNLERQNPINTNFIYRKKYRAGAISKYDRTQSTLEYYNNIRESDYILCLRGRGNFSIRFYETLLMGRIPVFISTDCILPLKNQINWEKHVVWIEWKERHHIGDIVTQFHNSLSNNDFRLLQINNRKLWLEKLQPNYILTHCLS